MVPIYLDYNATTPIDLAVTEAMLPYLHEHFGNPSSSHLFGRTAQAFVDRARQQLADLIGAHADEIIFTGGGSEASNLALKGLAFAVGVTNVHIITSAIEHPATLQPCDFLRRLGGRITVLPVDRQGRVDPEAVRQAIDGRNTLVSIMHSNNEVGTLQPIREIAVITRERGAFLHTDAAQSLGKVSVRVTELGIDLLSVAGHKLYAPKGVGALYVRRGVKLEPLIHGAGHESGRRAGTENVPYLVGLGQAAELAGKSLPATTEKLRRLRDRLWDQLRTRLGDRIVLNGHAQHRLPNTLNVNFVGQVGVDLLKAVPEVAASTGSACHEADQERHFSLSPVLAAMGVPLELGKGAIRLTVGRFTTEDEVDRAAAALSAACR
jgi:cysteine desulfurase